MADANPIVALLPDHDSSLAKDPKATENFASLVDSLFESLENDAAAGIGSLEGATEAILALEKRARQASDGASVSRLTSKLLELLKKEGQWAVMNETVTSLCKKRGQLRRPIIDMIHLMMTWIDDTPDEEARMKLLSTLNAVAEGKIFVEVEKARLVRLEAEMLEKAGKVDEAAKLLQEVQVETFGAMEKRERAEYILNQMRLVLARNDYIRLQLISKKINEKLLEAEELQLKYCEYMVLYYLHEKDYLNTAKVYRNAYKTPVVMSTEDWKMILHHLVIYSIMSPHSDAARDLLQEVSKKEGQRLSQTPATKFLVDSFLSTELVDWPLAMDISTAAPFAGDEGAERWVRFRERFIQHYYKRITTTRAAELAGVSCDELENCVSTLVIEETIYARVDRPAGIIVFGKPLNSEAKLDAWSNDISKLLDLLQETCHLISNERMVHAAIEKRKQLLEKSKA